MTLDAHRPPRVSRETRLLVTTALVALVALWVLARLRFPERVTPPQAPALAPILAPLVSRQGFGDLADQLTQISARTNPGLVMVPTVRPVEGVPGDGAKTSVAALRFRDDIGVALLQPDQRPDTAESLIARDPATGLALIRIAPGPTVPVASMPYWSNGGGARYLLMAVPAVDRTMALPTLIAGVEPRHAPLWTGDVFVPSVRVDLVPGLFVFTLNGDWLGLTVERDGFPAIVPSSLVAARAEALLLPRPEPAALGIQVQRLTPALTLATGASNGVMVRWVDPTGPAKGLLQVADALEAADGQPLPTEEHWQRVFADLDAGTPVRLAVRRSGKTMHVDITPAPRLPANAAVERVTAGSALRLRFVRGVGSSVVAVDSASPAAIAGLRPGDVVTMIAEVSAPTPAQVTRAIAAAHRDRPVILAVRRGREPLLLAIAP